MRKSSARARARAPHQVPSPAEQDFAAGVAGLAALIRSETAKLTAKAAAGPLGFADTRTIANLAQAAKALQSGSLWGARSILRKSSKRGSKPDDSGSGGE